MITDDGQLYQFLPTFHLISCLLCSALHVILLQGPVRLGYSLAASTSLEHVPSKRTYQSMRIAWTERR